MLVSSQTQVRFYLLPLPPDYASMFCVRVSSHCTELLGVTSSELHVLYFEQILSLGTREDVVRAMTGSWNGQGCSVSERNGSNWFGVSRYFKTI